MLQKTTASTRSCFGVGETFPIVNDEHPRIKIQGCFLVYLSIGKATRVAEEHMISSKIQAKAGRISMHGKLPAQMKACGGNRINIL